MKKLHIKIDDKWHMVFCHCNGKIITTDNKRKALPSLALWGDDDLKFFQSKFANHQFELK